MGTLQAKRLQDAFQKARQVGRIEESVTIAGCDLVLHNLTPDDYKNIFLDLVDVPPDDYGYAYQMANLTRAVAELNGVDLRDVQFVEDEIPSGSWIVSTHTTSVEAAQKVVAALKEIHMEATVLPPEEGVTRTVKIELPKWLQKMFSGWGREAIVVAWRKFTDVLAAAEVNAKNGVAFHTPEETPEEEVRRHLHEMQQSMNEIPDVLLDRLLADAGLMRKTSTEELEEASAVLRAAAEAAVPAPTPATPPPTPPAAPLPAPPQDDGPSVAEIMATRQPLNQQYTATPVPAQAPTVSAQRRSAVPEHIRAAAVANTEGVQPTMVNPDSLRAQPQQGVPSAAGRKKRSEVIAEIEGLDDLDPSSMGEFQKPTEVGFVQPQKQDESQFRTIVEQPPSAGINPRFKPPSRF